MANPQEESQEMSENPETPLKLADVVDDMIKATRNMDMVAYRNFMELPFKERVEVMNAILEWKQPNNDNK